MIIQTLKYFSARSVAGLAYFTCSFIIISKYSTQEYGVFSIALTSAQVCALVASTWVGLSASLTIPGTQDNAIKEQIGIFSFFGIITCLISVLSLLILYQYSIVDVPNSFILPSLIFCFSFGMHENQMYILNARGKTDQYAISTMCRYLLGLAGVWLAVNVTQAGRENALVALATGSLFALAIPTITRQLFAVLTVNMKLAFKALKTMFLSGISSMIVFGLWTFSTYMCRLGLYMNGDISELGLFATMTDLANGPIVLLFQAVHLAWAPAVVKAYNNRDLASFRKFSGDYLGTIFLLGVPGLTALWFTGPALMSLMTAGKLGPEVVSPLGWIAATTVLSSFFGAAGLILLSAGYKRIVVALTIAVLIINLFIVLTVGDTALQVARGSAISVGIGTTVLLIVIFLKLSILIDINLIMSSITSSLIILFTMNTIGSDLYSFSPAISLILSVFISIFINIIFNTLNCRSIISEFFKKLQL